MVISWILENKAKAMGNKKQFRVFGIVFYVLYFYLPLLRHRALDFSVMARMVKTAT